MCCALFQLTNSKPGYSSSNVIWSVNFDRVSRSMMLTVKNTSRKHVFVLTSALLYKTSFFSSGKEISDWDYWSNNYDYGPLARKHVVRLGKGDSAKVKLLAVNRNSHFSLPSSFTLVVTPRHPKIIDSSWWLKHEKLHLNQWSFMTKSLTVKVGSG